MEKTYVYTTKTGGARGFNQCANDLMGFQHFDVLFKHDLDSKPAESISKRFFENDGRFPFDSPFSNEIHQSLVKIKANWDNVEKTETAKVIHEFMCWALTTSENWKRFFKHYTSEENNYYIYAERLFAGLASINNGNTYYIDNKPVYFNDKEAAAQFREFMQVQKNNYMPEGYRDNQQE